MFENLKDIIEELFQKAREHDNSIQSLIASKFADYGVSVITSRAIPDIRDGLKPVHRRVLVAMKDLNLTPGGAPKKSARIVGDTIGRYHPHGDTSVYEAMVGLAQPWNQNIPLVIGQGNFGSIDGDNPAAMRYTEAKLSKAGLSFFKDIDKDIIDYRNNYDSTEKEPIVLPVSFPNLLVNGTSGIAVGMATNIPSHNLTEVMEALIYVTRRIRDNKKIELEKLQEYIQGPDFPTGGILYNLEEMSSVFTTGKGKIRLRAKHTIEKNNRKEAIVITELPYQVNKAKLIETIANLVKDKKINGISNIRDESSKKGLRIYIELKNGFNPKLIWNQLVKTTELDKSYSYNMVALKDGKPVETNIINILEEFVSFRKNIIQRKYQFIANKTSAKIEIIKGLLIGLENVDKVINIVKKAKNETEGIKNLTKELFISNIQAKAILDMKIQRLLGLEKIKLEKELEDMEKTLEEAKKYIDSDKEKYNLIIKESKQVIKEFGEPRKSKIEKIEEVNNEDLIPNEECIVYLSKDNYLRRVPVSSLKRQNRGTKGTKKMELKENDFILKTFKTNSHNYLMFMTEKGNVYAIKAYNIPDNIKGRYVSNLFDIKENDKVVSVVEVPDFKDKNIIFVTQKGLVKKSTLEDYKGAIRKNGVTGIKLRENDKVVFVALTEPQDKKDIIILNSNAKAIKFDLEEVSVTGRNSMGVKGINIEENEKVVGAVITKKRSSSLLIVTENAYIKSSSLSDYKRQSRGGKGVYAMKVTSKTGNPIKILTLPEVKNDKELVFTTKNGRSNRIELSDITDKGRLSQGVKGLTLNDDDKVVDALILKKEDKGV